MPLAPLDLLLLSQCHGRGEYLTCIMTLPRKRGYLVAQQSDTSTTQSTAVLANPTSSAVCQVLMKLHGLSIDDEPEPTTCTAHDKLLAEKLTGLVELARQRGNKRIESNLKRVATVFRSSLARIQRRDQYVRAWFRRHDSVPGIGIITRSSMKSKLEEIAQARAEVVAEFERLLQAASTVAPSNEVTKLQQLKAVRNQVVVRRRRKNLPKSAKLILRAWYVAFVLEWRMTIEGLMRGTMPSHHRLHQHLHHPYPSEDEKAELAEEAGIQVGQVSTWFINARVREWKPLLAKLARESPRPRSTCTATSRPSTTDTAPAAVRARNAHRRDPGRTNRSHMAMCAPVAAHGGAGRVGRAAPLRRITASGPVMASDFPSFGRTPRRTVVRVPKRGRRRSSAHEDEDWVPQRVGLYSGGGAKQSAR